MTAPRPSIRDTPEKSENRPPASSTITCTGARSHSATPVASMAPSTAPSATSMCAQKSPKPRACQARRARSGARSWAKLRTASSTRPTEETPIRSPSAKAPSPRSAHQRRPSAGAETTPTVTRAGLLERDQCRPHGHSRARSCASRRSDRRSSAASRCRRRPPPHRARRPSAAPRRASSDLGLDRAVGLGDRRQVRLRLERDARAEAAERQRVRGIGELERELEVGAHAPTLPARLAAGDRKVGRATFTATGADHVIAGVPTCAAFRPRTR